MAHECETPKSAPRQIHDKEELDDVMAQLESADLRGDARLVVQAQLCRLAEDDPDLFVELKPGRDQPANYKDIVIAAHESALAAIQSNAERMPELLILSRLAVQAAG